MNRALYTVGHSNHNADAFVAILRRNGIDAIADVRSSPYSKFAPQFNRETLSTVLRNQGIQYVFLGRELGARREERDCYVGNQARYDLIAKTKSFRDGLDRVIAGAKLHAVALMCSEKDPITCHRMVLVCRELRGSDLSLQHVLEDGSLESNFEAENRLLDLADLPRGDLFRSRDAIVEEAYERQARRIAWTEREPAGMPSAADPSEHGDQQ
jgi:uncharacterized protein (DUF488 family)